MKKQQNRKTIKVTANVWWVPKDDSIRIAVPGSGTFIVRVYRSRERLQGHPKLYRELTKLLRKQGAPSPGAHQ